MIVTALQYLAAAGGAFVGFQASAIPGALVGAMIGYVLAWVLYKFVSFLFATILWIAVLAGLLVAFLYLAG